MKRLTTVFHLENGMIMAFDQFGAQMPEYQGRAEEALPKIRRDAPDLVVQRGAWIARVGDHAPEEIP